MKRVFISYAREDAPTAMSFYQALIHVPGVQPWLDTQCLLPGQDWRAEITKEIRRSDYFLALLSSNSVSKKGFVQKELREALDVLQEIPPAGIYLIPVRLDECQVPTAILGSLHHVDVFKSWDEAFCRVLAAMEVPSASTQCEPLWSSLLGTSNDISIFVGAGYHGHRVMVFDWDVRTATNLVSYLASRGYRPTLEPPAYPPEFFEDRAGSIDRNHYFDALQRLVHQKNSVIVGPADANPLTEMVLGTVYGTPRDALFRTNTESPPYRTDEIIAVNRQVGPSDQFAGRRYFSRESQDSGQSFKRGFVVGGESGDRLEEPYLSQDDAASSFAVLAHLVISENPFCECGTVARMIVLNGVSGPATFALSQLLTSQQGSGTTSGEAIGTISKFLSVYLQNQTAYRGLELLVRTVIELPNVIVRGGLHEGHIQPYDNRLIVSSDVAGSVRLMPRRT